MSTVANTTHRRGNLPFDLTGFVGRRREIAEVRELLRTSRLVTLTGFGGVGKTRLALRVASDVERAYRDGVWLVDLAPLQDPDTVAHALVAALGIREETTTWSLTTLAEFLRDRHTLFVLDNCEHLIDACAALADTLLRSAPELTIIATSRQRLGVPGESIFAVPPLPAPELDAMVPPAAALSRYDAVALLLERGQAAEPSFRLTPDNAEAVTRLTQRLEGIPLAIELAAARLRVLTPQQILDRLDDRYDLLTSTARTVSPRQESVQALIDWSFDLCTEQERLLWARLSVFPRDFDIDAAEAICSDDELPREQVLRTLSGLVDKSIVVTEERDGEKRHRLPETLREYGRTRLAAAGSERTLRLRHRDCYRRWAGQAYAEWFSPRQVEWNAWSQAEYINLRAALEFCLAEPGQAATGLTLVPALSLHWAVGGSLGEARRLLDRVLNAATEPSADHAIALCIAALQALEQSDISSAEAAAEKGSEMARDRRDGKALSLGLGILGVLRTLRGDVAAAARLFDEAVDAARGDPLATAMALLNSARLAAAEAETSTATERLDRCLALCEAHGESWVRAEALWLHARLAWQHGDLAVANDMAMAALRPMRALPNHVHIANCLEVLAWIAADESRHKHAARLLGMAGAVRDAHGVQLSPSLAPSHDRCEDQLRRAMGKRDFEKAALAGTRQRLDDVVALALGERVATTTEPAADAVPLTRREREVADLVARGLSNREIAADLVISTRTAETHVEHILSKMGFTSRSQIAAWVVERRAERPS